MTGQRSQQTAILLDILRLPQRVLPKMGRSGRAARRRAIAATKHRMHNEAERLRERYNCPDPNMRDGQHTTMAVDTMEHTAAQGGYERPKRAASMAAAETIRRQAADITDTDTDDAESGVAAAGSCHHRHMLQRIADLIVSRVAFSARQCRTGQEMPWVVCMRSEPKQRCGSGCTD